MSANRNKLSVALDIATPEGQATVRAIAAKADVVIENFKPGGLVKYGLDHDSLRAEFPALVYCSISGYGQTGPNREKPGYDLMAQGFGGIMSLTGEPDGQPMKVGVGIADVMCGMYATVGILAALRHRDRTGQGQHIDIALVDSQVAWLINEGVAHLTTGGPRPRRGNQHATIVPYQTFATSDGHVLVAVGNDSQYRRFCDFLGRADLAGDPAFATNPGRLANRSRLIPILEAEVARFTSAEVIAGLEARKVPVGPVNCRLSPRPAALRAGHRGGACLAEGRGLKPAFPALPGFPAMPPRMGHRADFRPAPDRAAAPASPKRPGHPICASDHPLRSAP